MDNIKEQNSEKLLLTVKEVSELLGVSKIIVRDLINHGYLPAMSLGKIKVRRKTLEKFLELAEGKDFRDMDAIKPFRCEAAEE